MAVKIANYMFNKEQHFFRVSKNLPTNYLLTIRKKTDYQGTFPQITY